MLRGIWNWLTEETPDPDDLGSDSESSTQSIHESSSPNLSTNPNVSSQINPGDAPVNPPQENELSPNSGHVSGIDESGRVENVASVPVAVSPDVENIQSQASFEQLRDDANSVRPQTQQRELQTLPEYLQEQVQFLLGSIKVTLPGFGSSIFWRNVKEQLSNFTGEDLRLIDTLSRSVIHEINFDLNRAFQISPDQSEAKIHCNHLAFHYENAENFFLFHSLCLCMVNREKDGERLQNTMNQLLRSLKTAMERLNFPFD